MVLTRTSNPAARTTGTWGAGATSVLPFTRTFAAPKFRSLKCFFAASARLPADAVSPATLEAVGKSIQAGQVILGIAPAGGAVSGRPLSPAPYPGRRITAAVYFNRDQPWLRGPGLGLT